MSIPIVLQWGTLPGGSEFCFTDPETYKNAIFNLLSGYMAGNFAGVTISSTTPTVDQQSNLWIKINPDGSPIGSFLYSGGFWVWPHPIAPGSKFRMIWADSEANLWSEDGGDGTDPTTTPPTLTTGSFWQVDTAFSFKLPIGAGTNGVTYDGNPATVINQGDTMGEERHQLVTNETPEHRHFVTNDDLDTVQTDNSTNLSPTNHIVPRTEMGSADDFRYAIRGTSTEPVWGLTSATGADESHNTLPPVLGVYYVKRTVRKFVVGA